MRVAIDRKFEQTLAALMNSGEPEIIQGGRKGIERESLRVTPDGRIAQTPHPRALGSALTNENITTDTRSVDRAGLAHLPHSWSC
jgi:glutamate--cysteine ligase